MVKWGKFRQTMVNWVILRQIKEDRDHGKSRLIEVNHGKLREVEGGGRLK